MMTTLSLTETWTPPKSSAISRGEETVQHKSEILRYLEERITYITQTIEQLEQELHKTQNSFEFQIQQVLQELLEKGVLLQHIDDIREYLLRFPDIIDILPLAVDALIKYFPNAQLILDVYKDPEIEDSYLIIYVRLERYNESFIEQLEKAESEFLDLLVDKEGWIQVTTDFKMPER